MLLWIKGESGDECRKLKKSEMKKYLSVLMKKNFLRWKQNLTIWIECIIVNQG